MRACQWAIGIVGVLYLVALALFLIGTFGFFGQEPDPLSGIFLLPLGLPWVLWLDSMPEGARLWLAILAPAVNLAMLAGLCRIVTMTRPKP
ncbi:MULTISPECIES: hypothetical protein [unclassified Roseitalea]|uniref:hypothetical protein n=1 Tax=unclassified Roseitalea TaxID=2639107 RepID=UPI00273FBC2F|nr:MULTISPECIES: hypothetical protein [unclassified Roseitalea]